MITPLTSIVAGAHGQPGPILATQQGPTISTVTPVGNLPSQVFPTGGYTASFLTPTLLGTQPASYGTASGEDPSINPNYYLTGAYLNDVKTPGQGLFDLNNMGGMFSFITNYVTAGQTNAADYNKQQGAFEDTYNLNAQAAANTYNQVAENGAISNESAQWAYDAENAANMTQFNIAKKGADASMFGSIVSGITDLFGGFFGGGTNILSGLFGKNPNAPGTTTTNGVPITNEPIPRPGG